MKLPLPFPWPTLLLPLAYLYGWIVVLRNRAYDWGLLRVARVKTPVISIGNITVGGSGKTPFARFLAEHLLSSGRRPVILSRGYGGSDAGPRLVVATDSPKEVGDEAVMQARAFGERVPVVIARERVQGANYIERQKLGDVILLDDGFQHRKLGRNLDLLLFDSADYPTNASLSKIRLLPAGTLRESLRPALRRADAVVLVERTSAGASPASPAIHFSKPTLRFRVTPRRYRDLRSGDELALTDLAGVRAIALTAIAKPESFVELLQGLGVLVEKNFFFRDHHLFQSSDLIPLHDSAASGLVVITTEKDSVKLEQLLSADSQNADSPNPALLKPIRFYVLDLAGETPDLSPLAQLTERAITAKFDT